MVKYAHDSMGKNCKTLHTHKNKQKTSNDINFKLKCQVYDIQ